MRSGVITRTSLRYCPSPRQWLTTANLIIDTGAPLLFVATKVGKELGLKADDDCWATLDRFEIEGGVVQEKTKCRVDTPFQLEGMNGMGLAGAELHGVLGYTVLAKYRMQFDFTKNKLLWTPLLVEPWLSITRSAQAA